MSKRRRVIHALIGLLCLSVLGADLFVLSQRNVTTEVTFEDALARFQAGRTGMVTPAAAGAAATSSTAAGGAGEGGSSADPGAVAPAGDDAQAASPPAPEETPRTMAAPAAAAPVPAQAQADAPEVARYVRPPEGVYSYRTEGWESISVGGAKHEYPARTYTTVTHLDGCRWEARGDVIEEHVDRRIWCSDVDRLLQHFQSREVEFFGKRDQVDFTCDPPGVLHAVGLTPGATEAADCADGKGNHARLVRTYHGTQTMTVGGESVVVEHLTISGSFSGKATGSSEDAVWVLASNGLTVRWDRTVDTLADAAFGAKVRYREQASFVLESLIPAT
jgi:hypothetical protein